MILDFEKEKSLDLSTKQMLTVLDYASQAANDSGLMCRYVFRKALLVFAVILYYPDRKDEISAQVGEGYDISVAYDNLNADGTFTKMYSEHTNTLDYLSSLGEEWFQDVRDYAHSARGLLDALSTLSGDVVQSAYEKLEKAASSESIAEVLKIGESLGVSRKDDASIRNSGKLKVVEDAPKPKRTRRKKVTEAK